MVQAYILIQTEVGRAREVATVIREMPGVLRVDAVTGPYDVVVLSEVHSVDELDQLVLSRMHVIGGIQRTLTCSVVHF